MSRIMDAQIAADMALAAMDNRASWDAMVTAQRWVTVPTPRRLRLLEGQPQPRSKQGAPLYLAARATMQAGYAVWMLED